MSLRQQKLEMELEITDIIRQMNDAPGGAKPESTLPPGFEDIIGACFVDNYSCRNPEEFELMKQLRLLNCHFTWTISTIDNSYGTPITARIQNLIEKDDSSPSEKYDIHMYYRLIQLAYYLSLCKEFHRSLELLRNATCVAEADGLEGIQEGLKYVVNSNRAFIWMLRKDYEQCEKILNLLSPFSSLDDSNQAAVMGVYGETLMELGVKGSEKAILVFRDCINQDPKSYHWHSCLGVALQRIRHIKDHRGIPSDEESSSLRKAVDLGPRNELRPTIFLAQCLREKASAFFHAGESKTVCNEVNREVRDLYDRALEANPDCSARHLIRFADGYMKLPYPYKDTDTAEVCIRKALALAENNVMVNHKAGTFCEIVKQDYKQALEYLLKAASNSKGKPVFPVDIKLVDLRALLEPQFDPVRHLTELLDLYKMEDDCQLLSLHIFRGLFYYLENDQVKKAVEDWVEAHEIDEVAFEREFFVFLRSHSFMENRSMKEKIEQFPNHLTQIIKSQSNEDTKELLQKISAITKSFISKTINRPPPHQRGGGRSRGGRPVRSSRGGGGYRGRGGRESGAENWRNPVVL